jgi:hypothetical protein
VAKRKEPDVVRASRKAIRSLFTCRFVAVPPVPLVPPVAPDGGVKPPFPLFGGAPPGKPSGGNAPLAGPRPANPPLAPVGPVKAVVCRGPATGRFELDGLASEAPTQAAGATSNASVAPAAIHGAAQQPQRP